VLEHARAGFRDIVHMSVYLHEAEDYQALNEARTPFYKERFPDGDLPASTAVVAPSPVEGVLVEFEAIAYSELAD
jgi:enamine deaminase RidA (YjgF/YER057c/UK114 family)